MKGKVDSLSKILTVSVVVFFSAFLDGFSQEATNEKYYTEEEFFAMDKIDAHCHIFNDRSDFMDQAVDDNFRILAICGGSNLDEQMAIAVSQQKKYPGRLEFLSGFSMEGWEKDDWATKTIAHLESTFKKGAIGIKIWKNIGMIEKDRNGNFIMIDDPKFDPVFDFLEDKGIPVCGHLGEPRNCWLPIEEMTVNNDKQYFRDHPEFHMYLHPEYPTYEEQIAARDHMLEKHPRLKFMGAHLASLEWSIDSLARHLDRFPMATVDMAERICHLQVQAQKDHKKVRDFMIKYQDRILYGTDRGDYGAIEKDSIKTRAHEAWINDWKFFTTGNILTAREVDGEFKGLKLPKEVIEKIYYKNAEKLFPQFKESALSMERSCP